MVSFFVCVHSWLRHPRIRENWKTVTAAFLLFVAGIGKCQYMSLLLLIIKCSSNYALCDWSVRVHYSSIKHVVYVTNMLYKVIMHAV